MKVQFFLDVKNSLLNSECPLKALKMSKGYPVRPLDSRTVQRSGKEQSSQTHWLVVPGTAEPREAAEQRKCVSLHIPPSPRDKYIFPLFFWKPYCGLSVLKGDL